MELKCDINIMYTMWKIISSKILPWSQNNLSFPSAGQSLKRQLQTLHPLEKEAVECFPYPHLESSEFGQP